MIQEEHADQSERDVSTRNTPIQVEWDEGQADAQTRPEPEVDSETRGVYTPCGRIDLSLRSDTTKKRPVANNPVKSGPSNGSSCPEPQEKHIIGDFDGSANTL